MAAKSRRLARRQPCTPLLRVVSSRVGPSRSLLCHPGVLSTARLLTAVGSTSRSCAVYTVHCSKLVAATGWAPSTEFTDTVASVLQYWRREVKVRFELI